MTVETNLKMTEQDVRSFSEMKGEPSWFTELRLRSFGEAQNLPLPKPDKTKILSWNFTDFPVHSVESSTFDSLEDLTEDVKAIVDLEQKNLYIQHNNTPAFSRISDELAAQGVI